MADLADAGLLNLDVFEHERFKLDQVNEALDTIENRTVVLREGSGPSVIGSPSFVGENVLTTYDAPRLTFGATFAHSSSSTPSKYASNFFT